MPADDAIPLRGPGGQPLTVHPARPRLLLIGEGAGIGPTLFVAERVRELTARPLHAPASPDVAPPDVAPPDAASPDAASPDAASPDAAPPDAASPDAASPDATPPRTTLSPAPSQPAQWRPLVLLGSIGLPFPFRARPSVIVVPGIPTGVIACMPLLEEWDIASRLASTLDLPGCFDGSVIALADAWLTSLSAAELAEVEIFPNGPAPMVQEAVELSARYGVGCQVQPPGQVPAHSGYSPHATRYSG